jgi:thiopeptide-type bacteriocin biosynthesis protein
MAGPRDFDLRAGPGVVVRTPLLPLTTFVEWGSAPDAASARKFLAGLLELPEVNEAIYVASTSLHASIAAWREKPESVAGQRTERALVKYVSRMAGRSTPFGLFSGVSAGSLGRQTRIELAPRAEYRRRTRLDNDYLFVLVGELAKSVELRESLDYRPNTSVYRIAGRLRYAAARLDGKERRYHLVSVESTPYLEATLERAAPGARLADLATPLVDAEVTFEDARAFVDELVDSQLLMPELGVHVTGPEPIDGVLAQLESANAAGPRAILESVRAAIAAIDAAGVGNAPDRYRAIATTLEALPAKLDMSLLFQVDMVKPASVTLGNRAIAELTHAIEAIARIAKSSGATGLEDFRRAFQGRWEDREIPLAEALDEESGIGFESARGPGTEGAPLLEMLGFPPGASEPRVAWRALEQHMLRRLGHALAAGETEIVLADADLEAMKLEAPARMPDAFAAMFRLEGTAADLERGELTMLFEGVSGPSGARLLGRFCHASADIDQIVRAHHAAEEAMHPDAVFAEIVHLNDGRIGNILCRPVLRGHEIVFLGMSGAADDLRIMLDDLLVSVSADRIVLRSRRLGREVIPRLTTAHNYRLRSLCVYRFLCALANQGVELPGFSWGAIGGAPFLPRVRIGRVVVARATWNLDARDVADATAAMREMNKGAAGARDKVAAAVAALRTSRRLPRHVAIAEGDNELPIDLDNPLSVIAFADEIAAGTAVVEMFPAPDRLVVLGPEGRFANEVIVTFTRTKPAPGPRVRPEPAVPVLPVKDQPEPEVRVRPPERRTVEPRPRVSIRRSFGPGSGWLYAKLYCGESTADRVLREAVAPLVRESLARGDASHWFFIRYSDPDSHLRLRFAGDPTRLVSTVLPALERAVEPLIAVGAVRKVVLDTYEREVERYGGDRGIELVEQLFWHDSEAVLSIIELLDGDAGSDARWRLAVRGIDSMLDALGLDADARARVVTQGRESLGTEHRANTGFWSRVGDRFAKERASLDILFARDPKRDAGHDLEPGFAILAGRDAKLVEVGAELRRRHQAGETASLEALAWSLAHMHANRILHASQRAQELVLYDFLRRLHASRRARAKGSA